MPCSLAQTMRYHYLDNIPYSKMCELCELCELFVKKIPPLSRWDLLISTQHHLFVAFDFWNARMAIGTAAGFWNARSALERSSPKKGS